MFGNLEKTHILKIICLLVYYFNKVNFLAQLSKSSPSLVPIFLLKIILLVFLQLEINSSTVISNSGLGFISNIWRLNPPKILLFVTLYCRIFAILLGF